MSKRVRSHSHRGISPVSKSRLTMTTAFLRLVLMNLAKTRTLTALLLITQLLLPVSASASVREVWAVNDGEKVERDDLDNPNKSANSAWDGHKIKIFGARNEIIAFQLIIEAGPDGINQLNVSLPEYSPIPG